MWVVGIGIIHGPREQPDVSASDFSLNRKYVRYYPDFWMLKLAMQQNLFQQNEVQPLLKIAFVSVKAVAAIYLVLVMFPNIPVFADKITGSNDAPGLYLVQMILGVLLFFVTLKHYRHYLSLRFFHWIIALFLVYVWTLIRLKYFLPDATEDDISHAIDRIERALLIPVFLLVMFNSSRRRIERLFFLAVFLVPIPIILNFFFSDWFVSSVQTRGAGTFINANQAAEATLLWLFIVYQRLPRLLVAPFYVLAGIAVVLTFSRAGMLAWAAMGVYLIYSKKISRWNMLIPVLVVMSYSTILIKAEDWLSRYIDNEAQVTELVERIDVFGKLGSGKGEAIDDGSRVSREKIALYTLEDILKKPVLGYGYEVERNLGLNAHNVPLQLWYTYGLLGLVLFFWMGFLLFRAGKEQGYGNISPFFMLYVWFSFFDHAHITDNYWLIVYAFLLRHMRANQSALSVKPDSFSNRNTNRNSNPAPGKNLKFEKETSNRTIRDLSKTLQKKINSRSKGKRKKNSKLGQNGTNIEKKGDYRTPARKSGGKGRGERGRSKHRSHRRSKG